MITVDKKTMVEVDKVVYEQWNMMFHAYLKTYFGEEAKDTPVAVPDFIGMTRQQASDAAGKLGLYIQITGNTGLESTVTVTAQSIEKNSQVPSGTTIRLEFTDKAARD